MGEIRFVGTGETRGYPYLVCKKISIFHGCTVWIEKSVTKVVVVVALSFYVHGKHLRSCRDGQLT